MCVCIFVCVCVGCPVLCGRVWPSQCVHAASSVSLSLAYVCVCVCVCYSGVGGGGAGGGMTGVKLPVLPQ